MMIPQEIIEKAKKLGFNDWIEKLESWEKSVINGDDCIIPSLWYLTDERHLHNLASPSFQGYLNDDTPANIYDDIVELGYDISDWIFDHFYNEEEGD